MKKLRTGYTTGTCATAAAMAAVMHIRGKVCEKVKVLLPKGSRITIPVRECHRAGRGAVCTVVKDGGDDPDVTHGADIVVELQLGGTPGQVIIEGGEGVGRVTKPGLGLEMGGPAINPVPRRMILDNLRQIAGDAIEQTGITLVISVPAGRALAPRTDNPRLGILGGISILGTSGIVIPYSTASFAASIRQSLDVVAATGGDTAVLTTGSRSEDFARGMMDLPEHCFVQMGDFSGYAVQQCAKKGIAKAYVVGFVGKLAKMAAGVAQTHVKGSKVDMALLADTAARCGAEPDIVDMIRRANTARHVMEIVQEYRVSGFFDAVCTLVCNHMRGRASGLEIEVVMLDFKGGVAGRAIGGGP